MWFEFDKFTESDGWSKYRCTTRYEHISHYPAKYVKLFKIYTLYMLLEDNSLSQYSNVSLYGKPEMDQLMNWIVAKVRHQS